MVARDKTTNAGKLFFSIGVWLGTSGFKCLILLRLLGVERVSRLKHINLHSMQAQRMFNARSTLDQTSQDPCQGESEGAAQYQAAFS